MVQGNFSGFTQQTFEFFMKIGFENTPQRFEELRGEFNETVLLPLKQLSLSLICGLSSAAPFPGFAATPALAKTKRRTVP